jgi:glutamate racemase
MKVEPVRYVCALILVLAVLGTGAGDTRGKTAGPGALNELYAKDSITVVVTDSGLGGLSIAADAARKMAERGAYRQVKIIFYNALFTGEGGYNSLPRRADKVRIFDRALRDMQERYAPDVILIACNTLSVLYGATDFAAETQTPVVGIVDGGVELIADRLQAGDRDRVLIFATETTVDEGAHKAGLMSRGISADRIVFQKCPELASYIEEGFDGMETRFLIDAYVDEALASAGESDGALYVSLNCTHYGYAIEAWRDAFASRGIPVAEVLNPNDTMVDILLPESLRGRRESVDVTVRAVSMVEIPAEHRESIGRWLRERSPAPADALRDYELKPDLFAWRDVVEGEGGR